MLSITMKGPPGSGKTRATHAIINALKDWALIQVNHVSKGQIFHTETYGDPDSRNKIWITEEQSVG